MNDGSAERGVEKSYKAKIIVTLKNAGTQKGKTVTYTVPVTLILKK